MPINHNTSKKVSVAIIGLGVVGNAVAHAYAHHKETHVYRIDKDTKKGPDSYEDARLADGIFVCVPSPNDSNGRYDTSALESVLESLEGYQGVIISKVTATPDIYRDLGRKYPNLVHCPEFLTAANPVYDYATSKFMILGGNVPAYIREAERIIRWGGHDNIKFVHAGIDEAAMTKLLINSYLATKVVFMNEIFKLCQLNDIDYEVITDLARLDARIGNSHMMVPGPDGAYGFGGMCFPKDTSALSKYGEDTGADLSLLDTAIKKNTALRLKNLP